ncbi:MAG TPA: NmrA family NAD(P)-binding protein [Edaphobacter sp.]|jgi:NAD(P)H dehydrogenase (quinone)|nr:NmrA family NAD(P)-binding protein [Edaphobacter sp.]
MFAITGITGNVGGEVARNLLAAKRPVRAVVRDARKGAEWAGFGCEVAVADLGDVAAMAAAFEGAEGVFVMVPPSFDPLPEFPEAQEIAATLKAALEMARPGKVVYLSTIGAQAARINLLSQHTIIEGVLRELAIPITFLRPGWFMENARWDIAQAKTTGVIPSHLQPLDRPVPMVSTVDIGRVAAGLIQETWSGHRVVELEGPQRVTPNEIAATFARLLGRAERMEVVPRESWETMFRSQGMKNPEPRMRMLDGFNEGWIEFENLEGVLRGTVEIETALRISLGYEG